MTSMVLAGASTGLLLGILVGLSASPIVGTLLGAIVAIASALVGLSAVPGITTELSGSDATIRRFGVAALALSCLCGVIGGLSLRARDFLAPSPAELVKRWTDAGYSADRAHEIVAGRAAAGGGGASGAPGVQSTVLFAGDRSDCGKLSPSDHPDGADLERAFVLAGGNWNTLAVTAKKAPERDRIEILKAAWAAACQ